MRIALLKIIVVSFIALIVGVRPVCAHNDIQCSSDSYKLQGDNLSKYKADWESYFEDVSTKIHKKWRPPLRFDKLPYKTIVLFEIGKNGELVQAKLASYCTCKEKGHKLH